MGFFKNDYDEAEQIDELQDEELQGEELHEEELHEEVDLMHEEPSAEEKLSDAEEKRELRRQRRKHNELVATITAVMAVVVEGVGLFCGETVFLHAKIDHILSIGAEIADDGIVSVEHQFGVGYQIHGVFDDVVDVVGMGIPGQLIPI